MDALRFIIKKFAAFVVSIFVLAFVIFSLLFMAPGDPARVLVGARKVTPEVLDAIREQYHLNDPFFSQFSRWLSGAAHLDFGDSIRTGAPVTDTVAPHMAVTLELVLVSLVLSVVLGVLLGVISAKRRGRASDKAINIFAIVGTSAPSFAVGLLLLYVFALLLGWFPVYGVGSDNFFDRLLHLTLPAIALMFGVSAMLIKVTRSAMLSEVDSDYTMFMRARSLSPWHITKAQLKNAAGPVLTSTGLVLASLIGATVLVETTFAIPGVGNLLASSVTMKDIPVVQFLTLALAFFICLTSTLVDIAVYFVNPTSRSGRAKTLAASGIGDGGGVIGDGGAEGAA